MERLCRFYWPCTPHGEALYPRRRRASSRARIPRQTREVRECRQAIENRVRWSWRRWLIATGCTGTIVAGLVYWQASPLKPASAQAAPPGPSTASSTPEPTNAPTSTSDYSKRVVAYIHDSVPVTREQLGEYLIARYGNEKLELMVNKMIIDEACRARGVDVTQAEIEAQLAEDLKGLQLDHKQFVNNYLKAHHMNLYMWREDIIRPKLQLAKMVRERVTYTEEEVKMCWDAYHGEKIEARIILWPKEEERQAQAEYGRLRDNPEAFEAKSKSQASPQLSSKGGAVPPIGHHTSGCSEGFEKDLFSLQPGEITQLHEEPQGIVLAKCVRRIPPDTNVSIDAERPKLVKEIVDKKTLLEVPKFFAELRKVANPNLLMTNPNKADDSIKNVPDLLSATGAMMKKGN